jgi:hypothetical protein
MKRRKIVGALVLLVLLIGMVGVGIGIARTAMGWTLPTFGGAGQVARREDGSMGRDRMGNNPGDTPLR